MREASFRIWVPALAILFFSACATVRSPSGYDLESARPETGAAFRVFLLGGAGTDAKDGGPVLSLLRSQSREAPDGSVVIFLGDNTRDGLPDPEHVDRRAAESSLAAQMDAVRDFPGHVYFISGDRDWSNGGRGGYDAALRQEAFVERSGAAEIAFLPDDGLPGPSVVELTDDVVLIFLNTQRWLHAAEKPYGEDGDERDEDFLIELDDLVARYRRQTVVVIGHHPIVSNGPHAGRFPWRSHVFPLTEIHPRAYVPLPIVGSLPLLYLQHFGRSRQDLAHPRYASLRKHLERIFSQHDRLLYASAHERSLGYFRMGERWDPDGHLLISGSASGSTYVAGGSGAAFSEGARGFLVLDFEKDGSVYLQAWTSDGGARLLYHTLLEGPVPELIDPQTRAAGPAPHYHESSVTLAANPDYAAGALHEIIWGRQYRREWAAPITVPLLDLTCDAGGLTLLRRGGDLQTASLRFLGGNGVQYVARTIDKDPTRSLPPHLRSAFIENIVTDFNSSLHPYGALMLPRLADAVGVYHTNPVLRVMPDDPRLGRYKDEFAGRLVLFEERPDEDLSDFASFGHSQNVVGTPQLYREIKDDNDHRVDQRAFARARLLDMYVSDWDRYWDQWRWASLEPADRTGKIYRPVPRDRDWAFARFGGIVPSLLKYVMPKFQGFDEDYGELVGLNRKGMVLDRRFTSELSREDWVEIADSMRLALIDLVIEGAVQDLPLPIRAVQGKRTAQLLKIRRDQLPATAERHYLLNARVVDIVGSDKHEWFEVTDAGTGSTSVVVYKTTKEGEGRRRLYQRIFRSVETEEIRLYGLDGNDRFEFAGSPNARIRVRAIGGAGEDAFKNRGDAERGNTVLYDTENGATWDVGRRSVVKRATDPSINIYDRNDFEYDRVLPLVTVGSNNTDGIQLGGGVTLIRHGFRKVPYGRWHRITATVATRTQGVEVDYSGHFVAVADAWDVRVDAGIQTPNNVRHFYGLGNETPELERIRIQMGNARFAPSLERRTAENGRFRIGPIIEYTRMSPEDRQTYAEYAVDLEDRWLIGLTTEFALDGRDNASNPMHGAEWTADVTMGSYGRTARLHAVASSVVTVFASVRQTPQITIAVRAGGSHRLGPFPFYAAGTLGGNENLRGYGKTRFAGRSTLFQNVELRAQMLRFSTYVAPGYLGALVFVDSGRVWADGERSATWHWSYGGGLWMRLFDDFVMTATTGWARDTLAFSLRTGFLF